MNTRTLETNVGIINLSEREVLTEGIEMYFEMKSFSEEWKEVISESIEKKKQEWDTKFLEEKGIAWSEKGVDIVCKTLLISIQEKQEKEITYKVIVCFDDKENERLSDDVDMEIDLSEYEAELLPEIKNAVLEKFF